MSIRRSAIAALVGFGAGFAYREYRADLARARARIATGSRVVETASGPIELAEAGSGQPLLVVHGAGGGFDQGMEIGRPLADRLRVIAMSRFGYLRTPLPPDASAAAQADAHAALLDALGIERASIVGASAGAPSALELAIRHPERVERLVLFVPALYVPRAEAAPSVSTPPWVELLSSTVLRSDLLFWGTAKAAPDLLVRSILATPPELVAAASADEQSRVRRVLDLILPITARRLGLGNDGRVCRALPRSELERVAAPTLTISFADDLFGTFDSARYTSEHVPNGRFVGYPTGGHLGIGHQREVIDEIARFVCA